MNEISNCPVGMFDSGIGGLTVYKEIKKILPSEKIIYLGDTARVPYGTKSEKTIKRYSFENTLMLIEYSIKLLVVACNTSTAYALDALSGSLRFPVIGVIEPGSSAAIKKTKNKKVGVIGTRATIESNAYYNNLKKINPEIEVFSASCPLFVPLVEEGLTEGEITNLTIKKYLKPMLHNGIDTLILGCTHYPLLKNAIKNYIGDSIQIVDSAEETAIRVKECLSQINSLSERKIPETDSIIFTDTQRNINSIIKMMFPDNSQPDLEISFLSSDIGKRT